MLPGAPEDSPLTYSGTGWKSDDTNTPDDHGRALSRLSQRKAARSERKANAQLARIAAAEVATASARKPRPKQRRATKNLVVMSLSAGMIATIALPAYAITPDLVSEDRQAGEALAEFTQTRAQNVIVPSEAEPAAAVRDEFSATTEEELRQKRLAEQRERQLREMRQRQARVAAASQSAPRAVPAYSHSAVAQVALRYQGVPYVFGGASPAGFDCSGFVKYVYAQFGVNLPHSVSRQAAMGTRISASSAQAGDLVIINGGSHMGIYLGNGQMIDAPRPGKTVQVRAIWTSNHYFVRIPI